MAYIPQPVQGLLSTQGWQVLSLLVWKYSGTDQQPQTCGPSCTALTGRIGHLQWETHNRHTWNPVRSEGSDSVYSDHHFLHWQHSVCRTVGQLWI